MNTFKKINQSGIGLVETIVALGISVIIIVSLVSLSVFVLRSSIQSKQLLQSSKVANEQIQLVKAYRNSNSWDQFVNTMASCTQVTPCSATLGGTSIAIFNGNLTLNEGTATAMSVNFFATDPVNGGDVEPTSNIVRIAVNVSWYLGSDVKSTHIYTELANW